VTSSPSQLNENKNTPSGGRGTARFPRTARLLARSEFVRVYDHGRKQFSRSFTFFFLLHAVSEDQPGIHAGRAVHKFHAGDVRFGLTVGKVLGNSVRRNKIKRRTRELIRKERETVSAKLKARNIAADIVVHPKKQVFDADHVTLAMELAKGLAAITEAQL